MRLHSDSLHWLRVIGSKAAIYYCLRLWEVQTVCGQDLATPVALKVATGGSSQVSRDYSSDSDLQRNSNGDRDTKSVPHQSLLAR